MEASILFWLIGAILMAFAWIRYRNSGVGFFGRAPRWKWWTYVKMPGRVLLITGEVLVAVGYASIFLL